ncbi:MAG: ABC transporter substrate-binding protein, partial [Chloroflexi bacterium]|nr:ABC transporter substrate-binding protein [Chloroflexota bacterium]MDA1220378.1 ABC transporter substrate-binding protein [Chloroflexota bacterium]
ISLILGAGLYLNHLSDFWGPPQILPRTTMFLKFQAPAWWSSADQDTRDRRTIGFGPYKIVDWTPGGEVELHAFPEYSSNTAFDSQAPTIDRVFQVWRNEQIVRAAMVQTGEADWAEDIGFDNIDRVPRASTGSTNEVYTLVADNIWHPELSKKDVRRALALAIDCDALMQALYSGLHACFGNISQAGTIGITPQNSAPYQYDPNLARQLLTNAGYDPNNVVRIHTRAGRVYRDVELWEAVVSYWREVGVNAELQVMESSVHINVRRSGCGALENPLTCPTSQPPGPLFASSHYFELATSNEALDFQRQALLRLSCFNVNSRVCDPSSGGIEDKIANAIATPLGPERQQRMVELANIAHDEYYFIPMFQVVSVLGTASDLQWLPRYDSRVRVNTMRFGN